MNHWCVRWSTVLRVVFLCTVILQFFFLLLNWIILHLLFLSLWESRYSHFPNTALIYLEERVECRKRKYCYLLAGKLARGTWIFFFHSLQVSCVWRHLEEQTELTLISAATTDHNHWQDLLGIPSAPKVQTLRPFVTCVPLPEIAPLFSRALHLQKETQLFYNTLQQASGTSPCTWGYYFSPCDVADAGIFSFASSLQRAGQRESNSVWLQPSVARKTWLFIHSAPWPPVQKQNTGSSVKVYKFTLDKTNKELEQKQEMFCLPCPWQHRQCFDI